jgi:hypothetical protein
MAALRDWPEGRVGFDGRFPRLKSWAEWREDKGGLGRFIAPPEVATIQLSVSTLIITHIGRGLSDCEAANYSHYFQGAAPCHPDTGWKPMLH